MNIWVLFACFIPILLTLEGAPVSDDQTETQLSSVLQQLDRVELQLNNSISKLIEKIDENTNDIINLIKSMHNSQTDNHSPLATQPVSALLIIDVQNDFISGSLALRNCPAKQNGEDVIPVINKLLNTGGFDVVAYSIDWHPDNHVSFFDNLHLRSNLLADTSKPINELQLYSTATFAIENLPVMNQTLWPRHCVQHSLGAKLHPDLKVINETNNESISVIYIYKGTNPDIDSYSAFWDNFKLSETSLNRQLKEKNVTQVFVTGLATDWCVYSTAVDAIEYGYKTFIIEDAVRGVDTTHIKERLDDFKQKNGHLIQSNEVKNYI